MKKLYSIVVMMLAALVGYAQAPQINASRLQFIGSVPQQPAAKAALGTAATPMADADWQSIEGTCTFTDDAFTTFFSNSGLAPRTWNVTIQKHTTLEIYRVADPYKDDPFFAGKHDTNPDRYMYLNATDPEKVFFCDETGVAVPYFGTGIQIGYGDGRLSTAANIYLSNGMEPTDDMYAKLRYGAFEFPDGCLGVGFANYNGGQFAQANLNSKMRITLPDAKDYSCGIYSGRYAVRGESLIINLEIGADVATAKLGTFANEPWISLNTVAYLMELQGEVVNAGGYKIDVSGVRQRTTATFVLICYNEEGDIVSHAFSEVVVDGVDDDDWVTLDGMGQYTDGIYSSIYNGISPQTYDVQVQEHTAYKGYYRIVNPYTNGNWTAASAAYPSFDNDNTFYLYIDATIPEHVFVEDSPCGVSFGDGEGMISSLAFVYLCYDQQATEYFGNLDSNGLITFPVNTLTFSEKNYDNGSRMPIANVTTKLQLPASWAGIEGVASDSGSSDQPVEYFNLQGIRITNPTPGQLYISRRGNTAKKIIF